MKVLDATVMEMEPTADEEPMRWREAEVLGGRDEAAATTPRGESGDLEGRGGGEA